jgi:hypothetical protein
MTMSSIGNLSHADRDKIEQYFQTYDMWRYLKTIQFTDSVIDIIVSHIPWKFDLTFKGFEIRLTLDDHFKYIVIGDRKTYHCEKSTKKTAYTGHNNDILTFYSGQINFMGEMRYLLRHLDIKFHKLIVRQSSCLSEIFVSRFKEILAMCGSSLNGFNIIETLRKNIFDKEKTREYCRFKENKLGKFKKGNFRECVECFDDQSDIIFNFLSGEEGPIQGWDDEALDLRVQIKSIYDVFALLMKEKNKKFNKVYKKLTSIFQDNILDENAEFDLIDCNE